MADEGVVEEGSERSDADVQLNEKVEGGSEPEIAPTRLTRKRRVDALGVLQEVSEEALYAVFEKVISLIMSEINEKNSVPHAKFLVELVSKLRVKAEVSVETYESVAAVIWKSYRELQGTELGEPGSAGRVLPLVVDV